MKTILIYLLLIFCCVQQDRQLDILIERQKSKDPNYNGLMFEIELSEEDIAAGSVRFFLTQAELKHAWQQPTPNKKLIK